MRADESQEFILARKNNGNPETEGAKQHLGRRNTSYVLLVVNNKIKYYVEF